MSDCGVRLGPAESFTECQDKTMPVACSYLATAPQSKTSLALRPPETAMLSTTYTHPGPTGFPTSLGFHVYHLLIIIQGARLIW